jgi:tripartite-type tricarboxylate transporter receptor subunit TctC
MLNGERQTVLDAQAQTMIMRIDSKHRTRHVAIALVFVAASCALSSRASGEHYPDRPIHIVVPETGAQSDVMARALAPMLAHALGQPVVVENRTGAGGTVAAQAVARAHPDGYTLLIGGINNIVLAPLLRTDPGYAPADDLRPLGGIARVPYGIAVSRSIPAGNLSELIAFARAHPGKLSFGSSGTGSSSQLAIELLKSRARLDMVHVPYRGSPAAMPDLISGRIHVIACDLSAQLALAAKGDIRIVAVTGAKRAEAAPEISTVSEQGFAGYAVEPWYGLFAPTAIPNEIADALSRALDDALRSESVRKLFTAHGYEPMPIPAEALRALATSETSRYSVLIRAAGLSHSQ